MKHWFYSESMQVIRDGDSTLNTVAREVARECHGLPIALVTVGKALREKLKVFECPKLITKSATKPNGSIIRAQSEVSEVAEDSSTSCSAPISTYRTWT
ncbi:hypothetical protein BDE02_01G373500 [Populus trichocarpa]|nr:hypothetical protein BDE02_01G373500 [Populus trichocarpa]